jgi:hypothetical protein
VDVNWWEILLGPILKIIDKVIPDATEAAKAKARLLELKMEGELEYLKADVQLALGQMAINQKDAESDSWVQRTWRPVAAWSCVVMGLWYPMVRMLLPWALNVTGVQGVEPLPPLDTTEAMTMLFGLLGLGGMRMHEKLKRNK